MAEVLDFLQKLQDEYIANIIDFNEELDTINIKIKENVKFLELLSKENEKPFSEFSPRNVEYKNKDKMDNLKNVIDNLENQKNNLEKNVSIYNNKLNEIKNIINIYNSENKSNSNNVDNNTENDKKDTIKNVISFLPADPIRAKIELENLLKKI